MARKPAPKRKRQHIESSPAVRPAHCGPVLDPDHDAVLLKATWSKERIARFDAADDPVLCAREWLQGYAFRLETADRSRHFSGATPETYRRALEWAGDPARDRQHEALDILLDRVRQHPRPPYSPEVLLVEYERLFDMPVHARLRDGFVSRFDAWLDRVETYLSIGTGDDRKGKSGGEYREAAWFRGATKGALYPGLLKRARKDSRRLPSRRAGKRWRYPVDAVVKMWPQYGPMIEEALASERTEANRNEPNGTSGD